MESRMCTFPQCGIKNVHIFTIWNQGCAHLHNLESRICTLSQCGIEDVHILLQTGRLDWKRLDRRAHYSEWCTGLEMCYDLSPEGISDPETGKTTMIYSKVGPRLTRMSRGAGVKMNSDGMSRWPRLGHHLQHLLPRQCPARLHSPALCHVNHQACSRLNDPRARPSTLDNMVFQGEMGEAVQTCRGDI